NWRRCNKCQGLVHTVQAGKCIAGGDHEYTSQKYCLVGNLEFWLNGTYVDYAVHEMGHCYGLRHADYIKTDDYGDKWDIMGFGWHFHDYVFGNDGLGLIAPCGRTGPGLSAPNLDGLGWMPKDRIWTADPTNRNAIQIQLTALNRADIRGYLMAKIVNPDLIYTVEFRQKTGWDKGLPRDGVVISYKLPSDPKHAFIVSASNDSNQNVRMENADWQAGQTFTDLSRDIKISIDGIYSDASMVKVTIGKLLPPESKTVRLTEERNNDGRLEAFLIASPRPDGTANDLWHNWQTSPGGGSTRKEWSGWTMLGVSTNKGISLTVERNNDGRLEAFAIGTDSTFWHNWQTSPGGGSTRKEWSGWKTL
ncbi:MAG TPA: hypothetical protein VL854_02430, partial [Nitrososphaeraceae archaeon]|nr:hypothetical protein [Nitrososphaeraceae archaeon]